jgi:hypothetical protein
MRTAIVISILAALAACTDTPGEPTATVLSAAPESLYPGDDTRNDLTITISYTDGDGDLGRGTASIHDCRADGIVTTLMLPSIASDEAVAEGVAITGELALLVNDIGAVTPAAAAPAACSELGIAAPTAGQAIFCVTLTDAGGITGPGDCTAPVTLATP